MRCMHNWVEYKYINNGIVDYYKVCKWCGRVLKWCNGSYFETFDRPNADWQLAEDDNDLFIESLK